MILVTLLDREKQRKLIRYFTKVKSLLGLLCYLCGVAGLVLLAHHQVSPRNYVDENALMPGYVTPQFTQQHSAFFDRTARELAAVDTGSVAEVVVSTLSTLGLEVHSQSFSHSRPLSPSPPLNATNVYAVLRAQRGSGLEAVVVQVDLDSKLSVAFALALANFCRGNFIWAKDLVFLFTSGEDLGPQAWVKAYHGTHSPGLTYEQLYRRSGSIQAAISLQVESPNVNNIDISTVGQNGQLPNQDIFNALIAVCNRFGLVLSFDGQRNSEKSHSYYLKSMLNMMALQASCQQTGQHGAFVRHHIDSLTVRGRFLSGQHKTGILTFAKCIEGLLRSLNNLLEKLHHSFYSYLTLSSSRYLSISLFITPLVLLLVPPLLDCIELWFVGHDLQIMRISEEPLPLSSGGFVGSRLLLTGPFLYGCLVGVVLYLTPLLLTYLHLTSPHTLVFSLVGGFLLCTCLPLLHRPQVTESQWRLAKFLLSLVTTAGLFALSLLNFSLSFVLALFTSMPLFFARPTQDRQSFIRTVVRCFILLLASPPLAPFIAVLFHTAIFSHQWEGHSHLFALSWDTYVGGVSRTCSSHFVFQQWLYPLMCWGLSPLWMILWGLSLGRICSVKQHAD